MSNLIPLPDRATDNLFNLVPGAVATFFEDGTSTPLEVFDAPDLQTSLGFSVTADAEGVFPQAWTSESTVKVNIEDTLGVDLPGYPQDNLPTSRGGGTAAAALSFTPKAPNTATNVQAAIENNIDRLNTDENAAALPTSTGAAGIYALVSTYTITAYAAGQEFEFRAHQASTGGDTINVDNVGAQAIKKVDATNAKVDLVADDIRIGEVIRIKYDGTNWVLVGQRRTSVLVGDLSDFVYVAPASYTPTYSVPSGSINVSSEDLRYTRVGSMVIVTGDFLVTSNTGSGSGGIGVSLPINADVSEGAGASVAYVFDTSAPVGVNDTIRYSITFTASTATIVDEAHINVAAGTRVYLTLIYVAA